MKNDERHIVTLKVCELQEAIKATIKKTLDELKVQSKEKQDKKSIETTLIPRKTVAEMFSISCTSLDKWRRAGILPNPIKQGSRVYYLKSEIEEMIVKRKQKYYGR